MVPGISENLLWTVRDMVTDHAAAGSDGQEVVGTMQVGCQDIIRILLWMVREMITDHAVAGSDGQGGSARCR